MRINTLLATAAAGMLVLVASGCAGSGDSAEASGVKSLVSQVSSKTEDIAFDAESAQLLGEYDGVTFATASNSARPTDVCLLLIAENGDDLGSACADKAPMMVNFKGTDYAYGEKPSAEFGDGWAEESPGFWVR
ncbi:hypothetical protein JOF28_000057 [Leucobacter exalbidus]|uniref:Lipoprotein n=1 Tax=Leucobacter exalbidus TaxID=662960 RepID=A0A940SZE5_9MICO|nr:hypothetical protein [Leucobacter exalbidus]MBP1324825.1 hypothetical protein [Leucobacter exalbidus]